MKSRSFVVIVLAVLCSLGSLHAQMTIKPVPRETSKAKRSGRIENTTIQLPFWDDFSRSDGVPIDTLWVESENIWINSGMGIDPPSLNVATFDGFKADAKPYSLDGLSDGLSDVLTSTFVDLSNNIPADVLYLSFYYQAKGNGEVPNENDSLRVEFKDFNGNWEKAWSVTGAEAKIDTFKFVALLITDLDYYHDEFQFRFMGYGRQSGPFDTWNLDYVYLNDQVTNFDFPDRALQTKPTSIFKEYKDIPIHHFNEDPSLVLDIPTSYAYNLFDLLQPSNFSMLAEISSLQPDDTYQQTTDLLADQVISSFPDPSGGDRTIELVATDVLDASQVNSDTLAMIMLKTFMNTDDNEPPDYQPEFAPLDFRVNDTTYTYHTLHDYYAYDDGSAEFAAGLNFAGDLVAYEFPMYYSGVDTLVSVDLYFPNLAGSVGGQVIELKIWSELDNLPASLLYSESLSLQAPDSINQYKNYLLAQPVLVQDTFYIGWEQTSGGNLDIGLDKNNDSGERIYFNLDGSWNQNTTVEGSLMLRPRFGKADIILGVEEDIRDLVRIYPNPNRGRFTVEGNAEIIDIYDVLGRRTPYSLVEEPARKTLQLSVPPGIYLLHYKYKGVPYSERIKID